MTVNRKELKMQARESMKGARPALFWVMLLYVVIMAVLDLLNMSLSGVMDAYKTMYAAALQGRLVFATPTPSGGLLGRVLQLALEIMVMELTVGLVIYSLRVWRRQKAGCGDLFDGFGTFFRSIWIQVLPGLLVSMWSLLYMMPSTFLVLETGQTWWLLVCLPLLIPAVMAMFSYRLATYIMLDNPGMNCYQCVALSREIMRGHRWELFVLELSFLGWALLCVVPLIGQILMIWLMGYMQVVLAGFYERLATDFLARNAPPVEPPAPM